MDAQNINVNVEEKKINCPCCESINCFEETYTVEQNTVSSYLCMGCGYTTTTLQQKDSDFVKQFEETCPQLFKDIAYHDEKTNLMWYPTVLNFPDKGLVFPDGANAFDWQWRAVPVKPVSEAEKTMFPIPGEEGKFYETKADMESSRLYPQGQFQNACKHLGIIVD